MNFNDRLIADIHAYLKTQHQLLQVRSIEQTSQLLGLIITLFAMTAIVVVGLIFLAIALAAWLEGYPVAEGVRCFPRESVFLPVISVCLASCVRACLQR